MPRVSVIGGTPRVVKIGGSNAVDATARQTSQEALSKANQNATDIENGVFSGEDNVARQTANEALVAASSAVIAYNSYQDFADERLIGLPDNQDVLIRQDERYGGASTQGPAVEVEAYDGGGAAGTVTIVDAQARASAAAAQSTANTADGKADALDTRVTTLENSGGGGGATIDDGTISTAFVWSSSETNTRINSAVSGVTASSNSARTFESFGSVTSVDHQSGATTLAQRQANDTALISARNWCRDTGGIVTFLGRKYAFDATFTGHSYTNFMGSGWNQTHLVWPTGQHAIECQSASGDSSYGITLSHLQIGNETWNHNQSEAAASQYSAINITGRGSGPNDAEAYAREGVGYLSDPYHRFFFVCIQEFDGNGVSLAGRGEIDITHCIIRRTSGYGIDTTAPDLWITHNTVSETGLSGLRMNSGNVTLANNKFWFNGKLKQETVGAGMEFTGSGKGNVTSTNDRIQDTWGPGLQVAGSHFNFVGLNITEPAGGRVESQGDGFEGTRSQPRCAIRFENAKNCRIQGTVQNQNYQGSGSGDYPYLVYHADSGGRGNMVDLACELGDNWRDTLEVAGWTNADRWSRVIYNGDELLGAVDQADLGNAAHTINDPKYRPGAGLNLTNGGRAHWKGSAWGVQAQSTSVTPS